MCSNDAILRSKQTSNHVINLSETNIYFSDIVLNRSVNILQYSVCLLHSYANRLIVSTHLPQHVSLSMGNRFPKRLPLSACINCDYI